MSLAYSKFYVYIHTGAIMNIDHEYRQSNVVLPFLCHRNKFYFIAPICSFSHRSSCACFVSGNALHLELGNDVTKITLLIVIRLLSNSIFLPRLENIHDIFLLIRES